MLDVSVRHRFSGFALDATFRAPGGVTVLFGRSGSGKTTLVNAVAGLLRPDAGRVVAGGAVLVDTATGAFVPSHRRRIGYVFQDARLFPHLTVQQNLKYGRWFAPRTTAGLPMDEIVALLDLGGLLARRPGALSGGEKQRVALGRAILSAPRLLLLDEPLAALDDARRAEVLPYLERLRDVAQVPILYVSHSIAEVTRLATTVVMMDAGRVMAAGPAAKVFSDTTLAPHLGVREAGSLIRARVAVADDGDGLSRLDTAAGPIWLPRVGQGAGAVLRLRILAHDIILSGDRPTGLSALNILPALVAEVKQGDGPGALVRLTLPGGESLLVRITRRSAHAMGLVPGMAVHAVLKAVAVAPGSVGQPDHAPDASDHGAPVSG